MSDENLKPEDVVIEPITREIGERVAITGGRDYDTPVVRIVPSTYKDAQDHEKSIYISQGKNMGITLSLATLETALKWAKNEK